MTNMKDAPEGAYDGFLERIARALGCEPDEVPHFLTPAQVSKIVGESPDAIRRGIKERRIVADKINGRWRIHRDTLFANTKAAFDADPFGRPAA